MRARRSLVACKVHAQDGPHAANSLQLRPPPAQCLPAGERLPARAALPARSNAELNWGNDGTECTGAVRPTDGGIRMRFSRRARRRARSSCSCSASRSCAKASRAQGVPVNVTVIREGTGEFYGTQGDDKCMLDEVTQEPIVGIPHRSRSYRVVARGFCTEPARAIRGKGAVLIVALRLRRPSRLRQRRHADRRRSLTAGKQ